MVESDWVRENGLANNMEKDKFEKSLFDLDDTWASSIELVECHMPAAGPREAAARAQQEQTEVPRAHREPDGRGQGHRLQD